MFVTKCLRLKKRKEQLANNKIVTVNVLFTHKRITNNSKLITSYKEVN